MHVIASTLLVILTACAAVAGARTACAQIGGFQIVWVVVGEAASEDAKATSRAGRQLFGADDLMSRNMKNVKVASVVAEPAVIETAVGERFCLTSLRIRAFGPGQEPVAGAPLSIAIRQDHKEQLGLRRSRKDICLQPTEPGEYPLRLTSLLPAQDGTMRGAQVFLRAKADAGDPATLATPQVPPEHAR